jgi:hypothetical protein
VAKITKGTYFTSTIGSAGCLTWFMGLRGLRTAKSQPVWLQTQTASFSSGDATLRSTTT